MGILTKLVAGIDEAGRGPVIGPMVIVGVLIEKERVHVLSELGVKDSKKLSPMRREKLFPEILREVRAHRIEVVDARAIDIQRRRKSLNTIEVEAMAKIISELKPDQVQVGSIEIRTDRFREKLLQRVKSPNIVSVHHAEDLYPAVAAASIIAKVTRDRIIAELRKKYGDFGSGYPSDPKTVEFLKGVVKSGEVPEIVRKTWETFQKILSFSLYNTQSDQY